MGDVGSLALGGAIELVAVIIKQEILLLSIGGVFVLEALSVIIQVGSFKLTGKRVFRMAPFHHHFELVGWSETKISSVFGFRPGVCAVFADDFEIEVQVRPGFDLEGKRVLVLGLARTGVVSVFSAGYGAVVTATDVKRRAILRDVQPG